ncbi:hypothetical protein TVAG_353850 [Trichomonas vaginalis G3]|uniref:Uncharacterized protein n=1 Tax=Trichomonas vaginalis (strain ATCC PRA-98 / G3) TaxID=412133 RepID=A2FDH7_TRIV3|nr:hypothetical protein TVAGG3_0481350 [Trichomonas vaginalis G3]EAX97054.1 hypothetical protein TVAG_353850 [Trichomonas vaginalis G3]KAI5515730.1 hypothetical protein TVAGG3_0481350 [Trichomonas vaginalis G3]|eukprot:XP_001309984.1 hypothetical protein [Trichomonas vaginalis G3]
MDKIVSRLLSTEEHPDIVGCKDFVEFDSLTTKELDKYSLFCTDDPVLPVYAEQHKLLQKLDSKFIYCINFPFNKVYFQLNNYSDLETCSLYECPSSKDKSYLETAKPIANLNFLDKFKPNRISSLDIMDTFCSITRFVSHLDTNNRYIVKITAPPFYQSPAIVLDISFRKKRAICLTLLNSLEEEIQKHPFIISQDTISTSYVGKSRERFYTKFDQSEFVKGYLFHGFKIVSKHILTEVPLSSIQTWSSVIYGNELKNLVYTRIPQKDEPAARATIFGNSNDSEGLYEESDSELSLTNKNIENDPSAIQLKKLLNTNPLASQNNNQNQANREIISKTEFNKIISVLQQGVAALKPKFHKVFEVNTTFISDFNTFLEELSILSRKYSIDQKNISRFASKMRDRQLKTDNFKIRASIVKMSNSARRLYELVTKYYGFTPSTNPIGFVKSKKSKPLYPTADPAVLQKLNNLFVKNVTPEILEKAKFEQQQQQQQQKSKISGSDNEQIEIGLKSESESSDDEFVPPDQESPDDFADLNTGARNILLTPQPPSEKPPIQVTNIMPQPPVQVPPAISQNLPQNTNLNLVNAQNNLHDSRWKVEVNNTLTQNLNNLIRMEKTQKAVNVAQPLMIQPVQPSMIPPVNRTIPEYNKSVQNIQNQNIIPQGMAINHNIPMQKMQAPPQNISMPQPQPVQQNILNYVISPPKQQPPPPQTVTTPTVPPVQPVETPKQYAKVGFEFIAPGTVISVPKDVNEKYAISIPSFCLTVPRHAAKILTDFRPIINISVGDLVMLEDNNIYCIQNILNDVFVGFNTSSRKNIKKSEIKMKLQSDNQSFSGNRKRLFNGDRVRVTIQNHPDATILRVYNNIAYMKFEASGSVYYEALPTSSLILN